MSAADALSELVKDLAARALARNVTLVTAESCTGGLLAKLITDLPGSSRWFERGFVTYSNAAKRELLGVDEALLVEHGAVSEAAVLAMADGALRASHADVAVAVSGVAGPDGGTPRNPVGSVWLAWAGLGPARAEHVQLDGDRVAVREQAAWRALSGLYERLR